LPLKGAALAESLYASVAERPMADVDALALDGWAASARALEDARFTGAERADHAWSFVDPVTRGLLELHRGVTSCPEVFPLDADGVWARSQAAPGQVARVPSAEDLLVHLAEHALFQHGGVLSLVQWLHPPRAPGGAPPNTALVATDAGPGSGPPRPPSVWPGRRARPPSPPACASRCAPRPPSWALPTFARSRRS